MNNFKSSLRDGSSGGAGVLSINPQPSKKDNKPSRKAAPFDPF